MKPSESTLNREELLRCLDYDPDTGDFKWKVRRTNRIVIGSIAGNKTWHGYWTLYFCGVNFLAHRLAWFYVHGIWPEELDHIDGNPLNNKISNLRPATSSQNKMNTRIRKNNTTGFKGVFIHKRDPLQYRAVISVKGVHIHLGLFPTAEEAHAAYVAASIRYHGDYGRIK